ncbi:MAG: NADH:ubiquinone reductase (Na(+)-transporting) subunit B [Calditrichota bacterium]
MRFIRDFFDKQEKHFIKGGKFEIFYPLYEVLDTFFYTSGKVTQNSPHIRDAIDLKRMMTIVIYALVPAVIMALYNTGLQANLGLSVLEKASLDGWRGSVISFLGTGFSANSILSNIVIGTLYFFPVYIITFAVGIIWEIIFAIVRKHEVNEGFFVTSLLFPLILPPDIPLWQVAIGISFGVVIGKEVFGGTGMNILNPALTARAFLFFAYPAQISGDKVWVAVDGLSRATPLAQFADPVMKVSASWWDAFIGLIPGSMGETSTLACLIGAIILIATGVGSWRIISSILVGMVGMSLFLNLMGSSTNPMFQVSPMWHLVIGGFAFGAVFMATDPVTAAMTEQGKYLYGLLIGILVVLVRVVNPAFPEGMMLAILFMNVFAPIIDRIFINANIKRRLVRNVG